MPEAYGFGIAWISCRSKIVKSANENKTERNNSVKLAQSLRQGFQWANIYFDCLRCSVKQEKKTTRTTTVNMKSEREQSKYLQYEIELKFSPMRRQGREVNLL
jgi:hypothetical protein